MTTNPKGATRDGRSWRVLPQEGRGGAEFALRYPATDADLAALQRGTPPSDVKMKVATAGTVITDLPAMSVEWLVKRGWIEEVAPAKVKPVSREVDA